MKDTHDVKLIAIAFLTMVDRFRKNFDNTLSHGSEVFGRILQGHGRTFRIVYVFEHEANVKIHLIRQIGLGGVTIVFWVCIAKLLEKITGASPPFQWGERGTAGWNYRSLGHGQPKLPAGLTHKDVTTARIKNPLRQIHVRRRAPRDTIRGSNPDHYIFRSDTCILRWGCFKCQYRKNENADIKRKGS